MVCFTCVTKLNAWQILDLQDAKDIMKPGRYITLHKKSHTFIFEHPNILFNKLHCQDFLFLQYTVKSNLKVLAV